MREEITNKHPVVCFGEVLWDILPAGAVPGGAPMNVAYHLHKLGKSPALITRVGDDERGAELQRIFNSRDVCTDYFQIDNYNGTGLVYATPTEDHEISYDIVKPSAWDFIGHSDDLRRLVAWSEYFVFGSLAARNDTSRNTLLHLLTHARRKVLDINLRAPHYERETLEQLLKNTNLLKLNLAELGLISAWYKDLKEEKEMIRAIAQRFDIAEIVVTKGEKGAVYFTGSRFFEHPGFAIKVQDTVGSGDAFLAGLLSSKIEGKTPTQALGFANALGAFVATRTGACPDYESQELTDFLSNINSTIIK
jgi:fructokinase